ncbi:MAG: EamA family transporter [Lachnospiraceae bacterium]
MTLVPHVKKSLIALLVCYLIWGLQPLYWNLLGQFDALFVLCVRIVMSVIFTWGFLICTGRLHELLAAFRNRALMKYLVPAAVFICGDWGLYNWAVMNGHVLDVSLGYYMNPMVMFVIGLALFRERGHLLEYISVGVATLGVLISTVQYGSFPIVAVLCAFSWPLYATVKKAANADPIVSIAVEPHCLRLCAGRDRHLLPRRGRRTPLLTSPARCCSCSQALLPRRR